MNNDQIITITRNKDTGLWQGLTIAKARTGVKGFTPLSPGVTYTPYLPALPNFRLAASAEVDGCIWNTVLIYNTEIYTWLRNQDPHAWADTNSANFFTAVDVREDLYTLLALTWKD